MKKFTYTFLMITLIVSSSFLTSCSADEIADDSKKDTVIQVNQVDPPVVPPRNCHC
ncbi:hypothetical protein [Flavobacterium sp.]|uniref:hypothetical protein n=1 Tax=Flavobacterium sp. TaxID=239 RepID=UPI003750F9C4